MSEQEDKIGCGTATVLGLLLIVVAFMAGNWSGFLMGVDAGNKDAIEGHIYWQKLKDANGNEHWEKLDKERHVILIPATQEAGR